MSDIFVFDNSYVRLPDRFYARVAPTPATAPSLVRVNADLARLLGIDPVKLAAPEGVAALCGRRIPEGADPIALAYAGHQFGNFSPQLGDGRAVLLGELVGTDGARRDIQLKGSGPTPFSRRGDGRAALGPVLREYLVSEAMAALGVPTTRALAAVMTGDPVVRETLLPGAVLTRVASSHIRVGTFEFFGSRGDGEALRLLADHVIARHYPDAATQPSPYRALLDSVIARQAALVAQWLMVGFIHGVMNTDNMSIAGETIDYGPCAFMDAYDPAIFFSSIDQGGRYAFGNQPRIAQWNLARLAEAMLPLLADDEEAALAEARAALAGFAPLFEAAYLAGLRRKLGLQSAGADDLTLARDLLQAMMTEGVDFTLAFRRLADAAEGAAADEAFRGLFVDLAVIDAWLGSWRARLLEEPMDGKARRAAMRAANPAFIPRNHAVEAALSAAVNDGDFAPFERLLAVLSRPFEDQPEHADLAAPPPDGLPPYRTFCGT